MFNEPCTLDEATLLDYISGSASLDIRAAVEGSPACRAAAEQLARELRPLLQSMYRVTCPDPDQLVAYQEGRLGSTSQLVYRRHVVECPHCQAEYQILAAMDTVPLRPAPSLLRRVIDAVFQPPEALPAPLRGEIMHYQTPQISIVLSTRRGSGTAIDWTLRGEIRTHDGQRATGLLEAVMLRALQSGAETPGSVAENGTFSFQHLVADSYSLHIMTPQEEVIVRQLIIGDVV